MQIEERKKILFSYLHPYWAKPSERIRKFVDDSFKDGLKSCIIKGNRQQLQEVAVVLLLKWGHLYWTNYTSETLLMNAFTFADGDAELSDSRTDVVFIYHPIGLQRNSYTEEAISHNYTMRDLRKLKTVVLSEEPIESVCDVVRKTGGCVFDLGLTITKAHKTTKKVENNKDLAEDTGSDDTDYGNVSEVNIEKRGVNKGKLKVCFKGGAIVKYLPAFFESRIKVGQPLPSDIRI